MIRLVPEFRKETEIWRPYSWLGISGWKPPLTAALCLCNNLYPMLYNWWMNEEQMVNQYGLPGIRLGQMFHCRNLVSWRICLQPQLMCCTLYYYPRAPKIIIIKSESPLAFSSIYKVQLRKTLIFDLIRSLYLLTCRWLACMSLYLLICRWLACMRRET